MPAGSRRCAIARRVVVVGGGVSGLAVTYELLQRVGPDVEVQCLEQGAHAGGNIRTDHEDGYVLEWGPNGFLDNVEATPVSYTHLRAHET